MAGATARYTPSQQRIDIVDHGHADYDGFSAVFAPIEELLPASWLRMRNSLRALADDNHEDVVRVALARTTRQHFDEDMTPQEPLGFLYKDNELFVDVEAAFDEEPDPRSLRRILEPFVRRRKGRLDRVEVMQQAEIYIARAIVAPPRVLTLRDGYAFAEEVAELVAAVRGGEITRESALELIRARRADLLVDQPESDWLDAKRVPYALAQDDQKYELAKDAASFANGDGGLIVLGLATVDQGEGDVISRVLEFSLADVNPKRCRNILNRYVFPRIEGLEIVRVAGAQQGRGVAVIVVPAQRDERKPFLVHGVLVGGDVHGEFVGIPVRSGDETAWRDLPTLHAQIRLGEQALRGQRQQ
jgi:hypothetical protein